MPHWLVPLLLCIVYIDFRCIIPPYPTIGLDRHQAVEGVVSKFLGLGGAREDIGYAEDGAYIIIVISQ